MWTRRDVDVLERVWTSGNKFENCGLVCVLVETYWREYMYTWTSGDVLKRVWISGDVLYGEGVETNLRSVE